MKKKVFFVLISLMSWFALSSCSSDDYYLLETINSRADNNSLFSETGGMSTEVWGEGIQDEACIAYEEIRNKVGVYDNETRKTIFPDFYGGAWLTSDGKLVVLLKGDLAEGQRVITEAVENDEVLVFNPCQYSYMELDTLMDRLNEKMRQAPSAIFQNVCTYGLFEKENNIQIELENCEETDIEAFEQYFFTHPAFVFRKGTKVKENLGEGGGIPFSPFELRAGMQCAQSDSIYPTTGGGYGSWGFRAIDNQGHVGMTTCAHVIGYNEKAYYAGFEAGRATKWQYAGGGSVDAAFIDATNYPIVSPTNYLSYEYSGDYGLNTPTYYTISLNTSLPGVGTYVNKRGWTTGRTGGYITCTNQSVTAGSTTLFTNLTTANYYSNGGDSGGIVYSIVGQSRTIYTVGLHMSSPYGNNLVSFFCKASEVLSALNISRY